MTRRPVILFALLVAALLLPACTGTRAVTGKGSVHYSEHSAVYFLLNH